MVDTWPIAAATPSWQLAGTDFASAQRIVLGEFDELPALVQLPDRGVGADAVGRTAARLASVSSDLAIETTPNGWRLTAAPGRDVRRATSTLGEDLDLLEELTQGFAGPLVVGLVGPWTLAARIERANGERLLSDHGATRDLCGAMVEAVGELIDELHRRIPRARPVIRVDEPDAAAALAGSLTTQSGWGRVRSVLPTDLTAAWAALRGDRSLTFGLRAAGIKPELAATAGFDLLWIDTQASLDPDQLGPWFDLGHGGVLELDLPNSPDRVAQVMRKLSRLAGDLGLDLPRLLTGSALSPVHADTSNIAALGARFAELAKAIRSEVEQ